MSQLKVSVGPGKPNRKADVLFVQKLLNANAARLQAEPLKLDGVFGPKTAADVLAYQALVLGMRHPDGVVDPGERTIRSLMRGEPGTSAAAVRAAALTDLAAHTATEAQPVRPAEVQAFIEFALGACRATKRKWRVPISLLLAHAGLITGWGKHAAANAYFGLQGKRTASDLRSFSGFEVVEGKLRVKATYRAYNDFPEAADDFGRFLAESPRYRTALSHPADSLRAAESISLIWWSDKPHTAELVMRLIRTYGLDEYDRLG